MTKILLILSLLFFTGYASGQECEYAEYFRLTDLAKNDYKKKNFENAKSNFKLAFEQSVFPHGHDLSYALLAANEIRENQWAGHIAKKLAQGGIPLRYFSKFKKKKWYAKFESDFPKYSQHYKDNFDVEMRNSFLTISKEDLNFTDKYHHWREHKIELTLQELVDGATMRLTNFMDFNKKYGFPNEQKMGYNYVRHKNRIEHFPVLVLMIHIYQTGTRIFKDDIRSIVCKGSLHPSFEDTLKKIYGFGDSTGVPQEMKVRYKKYRGTE